MDEESEKQRGLDWQQQKPTETEITQMWSELQFHAREPDKVFLDYIEQISKSFPNGQIKLFCFEVAPNPNPYFDWFGSRGTRLNEINFLPNFLKHKNVIPALEEIGPIFNYTFQHPILNHSPLEFDARLATHEIIGGAYHPYEKSNIVRCREDAFAFWKKFTDGRFFDFSIFETREIWGQWFYEIGGDVTYVIYDSLKRRITLFALTDTD